MASQPARKLAACGVRVAFAGHHPQIPVIAKALHDTYSHLFKGGAAADLKSKSATPQEMEL